MTGLILWETPLAAPAAETRAWIAEVERRIDSNDREGALAHCMKDRPSEWREAAKRDPQYPQFVARVVSYRADGQALVWAQSALQNRERGAIAVPVSVLIGEQTFPVMLAAADLLVAPADARRDRLGTRNGWYRQDGKGPAQGWRRPLSSSLAIVLNTCQERVRDSAPCGSAADRPRS